MPCSMRELMCRNAEQESSGWRGLESIRLAAWLFWESRDILHICLKGEENRREEAWESDAPLTHSVGLGQAETGT